jgi:hypothetical protein
MCQVAADTTWEKVPELKDAYASFQLEDEWFLNGGVLLMLSLIENISNGRGRERPRQPNRRCQAAHNSLRKLIFEL